MAMEMIAKEAVNATQTTVKEGVALVKKAWSIMDAASEKNQPSEYLSPEAIKSIQGN